jgi:hypothetical protein
MATMLWALDIGTAMVALAIGAAAPEPERSRTCTARQATAVVSSFLAAFNSGDARATVAIMDPRSGPRNVRPRGWYSITEGDRRAGGRHHAFFTRRSLRAYFAGRHRQHESLHLASLEVRASKRRADVQFRVRRRADDLGAIGVDERRLASGKAALSCERRKIFVWSMAHDVR